ncbi:unnamed protein product [Danaus chrysippus]|uniref:(African queen) hypothetical protein n=1 Tax=Danaus chrysippus TaxID=151541 RepID=A0A8J2VV00_9NEOP|nr:unnamed protein product [Danaus chrysippus]
MNTRTYVRKIANLSMEMQTNTLELRYKPKALITRRILHRRLPTSQAFVYFQPIWNKANTMNTRNNDNDMI